MKITSKKQLPASLAASLSLTLLMSLSLVFVTGCGSSSTIELQPGPPAPENPVSKPGDDKSNKPDDGQPDDGDAGNNSPTDPTPAPAPSQPRYRIVCEDQSLRTFSTIQSTARGYGLFFLSLGYFKNGTETTRENANLKMTRKAMSVPGAAADHLSMYFVGRVEQPDFQMGSEHFYFSDIDVLLRRGNAVDLGAVPSISSGASSLAESLGLDAVNYGASNDGTFVLLPSGDGLKVWNHDRTKSFGTIPVSSSRTLFPRIFEKEKLFTALVLEGGMLRQTVKRLNITSTSVSVASAISTSGASRSALPIQRYDQKSLAWAESSSSSNSLTIAKLDIASGKVTRTTYTTGIKGAVLFPQAMVYNEYEPSIRVAVEKVTSPKDRTKSRVDIPYAKIQTLNFDATQTRLVEAEAVEYPASAINRVLANGKKGRFIMKTFIPTPNSDELLMTMDAHYGYEIFKDRGGFVDGVSSGDCQNPKLVQETL